MQLVDLGPLFGEGGHGQLMMGPHVAVGQGRRGLPTASIGDAPFPMMTASIGDAPFPADDMPGLGDLMEMMTSMRMAPPPMMRRPPSHPCSVDMQRTRCADVACLKRNARALSPPCLGMLMDAVRAEPSPAPEEPSSYSSSSYEVIVSDADGTRRYSSSDGAAPPAEVAELMGWLPGELSAIFGEEPPMPPPQPVAAQQGHPCEKEVDLCSAETSSTTRAAIEACLASHYTELSPSCQCFVHHVMGDAPAVQAAMARAAGAAPARAPVVRTVVDAEEEDDEEGEEGEPMPRKMKMRCVLGMVVAWGILAIIMRRLCILSERKSQGAMQQVCFITVIMLLAGVWPLLFFSVPLLMLCFAYTCVPARDRSADGKKKVAAAGPCPETVAGTVVPLTIETSHAVPLKVDEMVGVVAVPGKTVVLKDVDAADFETKYEKH